MNRTALASDIDGTLVFQDTENFTVSGSNVKTYFKEGDLEAIARWQAAGGLFGLCSGRSVSGVFDLLPGEIRPDFYIACSGAAIFDRNRNAIYEAVIQPEDIWDLFERYKDSFMFEAFHTDSPDTRYRTVKVEREGVKEVIVKSPDEIRGRKIYSVSMLFADDREAETICGEINKNYPALTAFQNKNSADIVVRGCSKGEGILRVKEHLQIDVMAGIGDSFNDLPMLKAAQPSFTFHGSPETIRRQVTYVVDSVAEAIGVLRQEEEKKEVRKR